MYPDRPRRLRVSSLAAVANPAYSRVDTWNLLDNACRTLAFAERDRRDTTQPEARARRLIDRLAAFERYWLYPRGRGGRDDSRPPRRRGDRTRRRGRCRWRFGCCRNTAIRRRCSIALGAAGGPGAGRADAAAAVLHGAAGRPLPGHRTGRAWRRACGALRHPPTTCSSNPRGHQRRGRRSPRSR